MSRIALVDDDRNILTSVSMTLEAEGFEVETYNDGQSALDAFNKRLPDMAVFDINWSVSPMLLSFWVSPWSVG